MPVPQRGRAGGLRRSMAATGQPSPRLALHRLIKRRRSDRLCKERSVCVPRSRLIGATVGSSRQQALRGARGASRTGVCKGRQAGDPLASRAIGDPSSPHRTRAASQLRSGVANGFADNGAESAQTALDDRARSPAPVRHQ
jgi:hypothetical protein